MSATAASPAAVADVHGADVAFDALLRGIAHNRFLPIPPEHRRGSGDGDFRAIGCEFLAYFVRLCGLQPDETMLDLGCGIGRIAVPLTQYLSVERGRYVGVDVSADGIHWCHEAITQVYPNFRFRHLDVRHPLYNPHGAIAPTAPVLPLVARSIDFACMVSVVTHLLPAEVAANAREVARVLKPGGRCLMSAFLVTEERAARLRAAQVPRMPFRLDGDRSPYFVDPEHPTAAVAYDEAHLLALLARAGLRPRGRPLYGHWDRDGGEPFQDLLQLEAVSGTPA